MLVLVVFVYPRIDTTEASRRRAESGFYFIFDNVTKKKYCISREQDFSRARSPPPVRSASAALTSIGISYILILCEIL